MGAILLLIVLVAAFSISGTMMMTAYYRRSQVALLRSLGMSRQSVIKLFLFHGLLIGLVGSVGGLVLGLGFSSLIPYMQTVEVWEPIDMFFRTLAVRYLPFEYFCIAISAWLLSFVAGVYPAIEASKQEPGVGLRYM